MHSTMIGLGLRPKHYCNLIQRKWNIDFLEILTENFLDKKNSGFIEKIAERYPLVMHGVSLSIGSDTDLDLEYLKKVKSLKKKIKPLWISDHLCWTQINNVNSHLLLPLPFTSEVVQHVSKKIKIAQDFLETHLLLENISAHIEFKSNEMNEAEFVTQVSKEADSYILFDVNNLEVNAYNNHFSADEYINTLPADRVKQFHIAGHKNMGRYIIDTHDRSVDDNVWKLYKKALRRFGSVPTIIERDMNIPDLDILLEEVDIARKIMLQTIN